MTSAENLMKLANSAFSASKTGWTRAKQFTEENIGAAEKTEHGAQFDNLAVRAEKTKLLSEKLVKNFEAVLQPNPGLRVEEFVYGQLDKKQPTRPSNTFSLGQVMHDASHDVGPGTAYGGALVKTGTALKKMGNAEKDFVHESFSKVLGPLKGYLDTDMKSITRNKRILEVKRLDLDAAKAKAKKATTPDRLRETELELKQAQDEYDEQFEITKRLLEGVGSAHNKQLESLNVFVQSLGFYHAQCQQTLSELQAEMQL